MNRPRGSIPSRERFFVCGVGVDNVTQAGALLRIEEMLSAEGSRTVAVVNASKLALASRSERLQAFLNRADLVTADGMSVVWASRLFRNKLTDRVTGIDLFERLISRAAASGVRVFLLGGREEVISRLVQILSKRHPDLQLVGWRNGYFSPSEGRAIAEEVRRSKAELLFVAMGSPAQEMWIDEHLESTGVRVAMGVGGTFDHLSGFIRRAPRWLQRAGLEWLFRLAQEPGRLWRRYLLGNTRFLLLVARQLLGRRSRSA